MTPCRPKLNVSVKRRSFGRSSRRLSNQSFKSYASVCDSNSNIKVIVRVRPLNESEKNLNSRCIVHVPSRNCLVFDPVEQDDDFFFQGKKQQLRDLSKKPHKDKSFGFDRVFDGDTTNNDVFEETALPIIDSFMNGFNCSVFAYGATGAGKTHTMLGSSQHPGISFLIVMEIFKRIGLIEDKICELSVSYLEVYNEMIKDLLVPSSRLQIREDTCVKIQNLSMHKPKSAEELLQLLAYGNKNRSQHPTDANAESSRSHAIFQIYLKQKDKTSGASENIRFGKMSLVDLAGSERATAVKNHNKARLKEGASINQSLLALGSCINALADKKKGNHIPYRNSKLTRILKDSLGGNCLTVIIAAVSPSHLTYEDTFNTLRYADRAKEIKLTLKKNVYNVDSHISQFKRIMETQQVEIVQLKLKLQEYEKFMSESTSNEVTTSCATCQTSMQMEIDNEPQELLGVIASSVICSTPTNEAMSKLDKEFVLAMDGLFNEQIKIRTQILTCESEAKEIAAKRHVRKQIHSQVYSLTWNQDRLLRSMKKMNSAMKASEMKESRLHQVRAQLDAGLEENLQKILSLLEKKYGLNSFDNNMVRLFMDNKKMEVEIAGLNVQTQHILRMFNFQRDENLTNSKISEQALYQVRKLQLLLKEHGFLTQNYMDEYEKLLRQVEGSKEVVWADESKPDSEPIDYVKNFMLLPVYKFTRESMSPWNRRSRTGLSCNPFSSTPFISGKSALAAFHNRSEPGDHSYIQVDSFGHNSVINENDEKLATPLPPYSEDSSLSKGYLFQRGKHGSPFPIGKKHLEINSLEDTFDLERSKLHSAGSTPSLRCHDEQYIPRKNEVFNNINKTLTYNEHDEKPEKDLSPIHVVVQEDLNTDTPPSPIPTSVIAWLHPKSSLTPPSPRILSPIPSVDLNNSPTSPVKESPIVVQNLLNQTVSVNPDNTFIMLNNYVSDEQHKMDMLRPGLNNETFLSTSPTGEPFVGKQVLPFEFAVPKSSASKILKKKTQPIVGAAKGIVSRPVINPVAPMMRVVSNKPSQLRKLSGSVSTPNLHRNSSEKKVGRTFPWHLASTSTRTQTAATAGGSSAKENSEPVRQTQSNNLGLRPSSLAISKPKTSLTKSKSSIFTPNSKIGFRFGKPQRKS